MAVLERARDQALAGQVNFAVRESLLARLDAASTELETTRGALCRNVVETFLDAYLAWEREARVDRARALEAIKRNIRSGATAAPRPLSQDELGEDSSQLRR